MINPKTIGFSVSQVGGVLKDVCPVIEKRYQVKILEIGSDRNLERFLV